MKVLTKDAVQLAATLLIHTNGTTTTLEVKELLRGLGYRAEQQKVSDLMNETYDEQVIELERTNSDNGRYQVYSFGPEMIDEYGITEDESTVSASVTPAPSVATGAPILQTLVAAAIASRDPEFVHYTEDAMIKGTTDTDKWVGYSPNASEFHVYNEALSRDQVRSRYASLLNIPIQQVRACRVKNYELV
jgi:hypothetical protein